MWEGLEEALMQAVMRECGKARPTPPLTAALVTRNSGPSSVPRSLSPSHCIGFIRQKAVTVRPTCHPAP